MNRNSKKQTSIMSKFLFILTPVLLITAVFLLSSGNLAPLRTLLYPVTGLAEFFGNESSFEEQNLPVEETPAGKAEKSINSMSPEQMAGQLMLVGFNGLEPDYYISRMINLRNIGGVVLFGRNIESPVQVAEMNNQLQSMSLANNNLPLFIAVDEEGGELSRFEGVITSFPGPARLGELGSPDAVELVAAGTAGELAAMGVNVNLAPVIDVGRSDSVMAGRVFGNTPDLVAELGAAAVNGYRKGGLIPCVKHFPGLGRSVLDTHD
ncbi:MAG: glycoside hydrolase family 3 N-terminal domain-containing protein, partial [Desulfotomaculaceae bacterium]|nr:glycoside hydrolase family 3 N-terminal domain-containing protein [Desulfotomaculaceae bacterium]